MALADGHEGERGRDGEVKVIYWQAPSILNPYLVRRHQRTSSPLPLVIEPMARLDQDGYLGSLPDRGSPDCCKRRRVRGPDVHHLEAKRRPSMV